MILVGGASADADGADEPAVAVHRNTTGDEEQRPVEGGGQCVEEPSGADRVDEVGRGGVELEGRVRLAGAGLARDEDGPVVPPEGEQLAARVEDGDGDRDAGGFGGGTGSVDQRFGVRGRQGATAAAVVVIMGWGSLVRGGAVLSSG